MAEIVGGGAHDGAQIQVPDDVCAIVLVSRGPDGEYNATLAGRGPIDGDRLEDCLLQFLANRARRGW